MLSVQSLCYQYHHQSPSCFSFNIEAGENIGLVGINGAGKSTLIKLMSGELIASSGSVYFNHLNVLKKTATFKSIMGYMPDVFPQSKQWTVNELLTLVCLGKNISKAITHQRVQESLEIFELAPVKNKKLYQLSLGQRQKVSLAQALINQPELLLLDEPMNGLDPAQQTLFWQLIAEHTQNTILLLASHHIESICQICQRLFIIADQSIQCDIALEKYPYLLVLNSASHSIPELTQLHPQIFATDDATHLNNLLTTHSDNLMFSGKAHEVITTLLEQQTLGKWSWS